MTKMQNKLQKRNETSAHSAEMHYSFRHVVLTTKFKCLSKWRQNAGEF